MPCGSSKSQAGNKLNITVKVRPLYSICGQSFRNPIKLLYRVFEKYI